MSSEVVTPDDEDIRCQSCLHDEYGAVASVSAAMAMVYCMDEFLMISTHQRFSSFKIRSFILYRRYDSCLCRLALAALVLGGLFTFFFVGEVFKFSSRKFRWAQSGWSSIKKIGQTSFGV